MTLSRFERRPDESEYPTPDQIFSDVECFSPDFAKLVTSSDYAIIESFVQDFLRMKNQYRVVSELVNLEDEYEANFIKYGREGLGQLLTNCIFTIWNTDIERRFLDICLNYYENLDKELLRVPYRPIATVSEFRFLYTANEQVDINASAFIILILLKYNGIPDLSQFLQRSETEISRSATLQPSLRSSQIGQSAASVAGSGMTQERSPVAETSIQQIDQGELKSHIIQQLESRLGVTQSEGTTEIHNAEEEIDRLKAEQALLVTSANDKINRYKAKLEKFRNVENEMNRKMADLSAQAEIADQRLEQMIKDVKERELNIKDLKANLETAVQNGQNFNLQIVALTDEKNRAQNGYQIELEKNKMLQRQCDSREQDISELRRELADATVEFGYTKQLKQKLADMNGENAELVCKYNNIVAEIQNSHAEIVKIERERNEFERELETEKERFRNHEFNEDELQANKQELRQMRLELEEATEQIAKFKALANTQDFQVQIEEKSAELQERLTENLEMKERIAVLEAAIDSKTRQIEEIAEAHEGELSRLRTRVETADEQMEEAEEEAMEATAIKATNVQEQQQIEELGKELSIKEQQLDKQEEEIGEFKVKIQDFIAEQALQTKNAEFQQIIEKLRERVAELENSLLEEEKHAREHQIKGLEADNIVEQYEKLQKEYGEKCNDGMAKESEIQNLKEQLQEKSHEVEMLGKQLASGKEELEELNRQFAELEEMNETDNLNLDSAMQLDERLSEKDVLISELSAVTEQYREQAHELKKELDGMVPQVREAELMEEIALLREQLASNDMEPRRNANGSATTQATENLNETEVDMQLARENEELRTELAILNTQKSMNLDQSSNSCYRCQEMTSELNYKEQEIRELKDELDRVTEELEMLQQFKLKEMEREIEELKEEGRIDNSEGLKYNLRNLLEEIDNMYEPDQMGASEGYQNFMLERVKQRISSLIE